MTTNGHISANLPRRALALAAAAALAIAGVAITADSANAQSVARHRSASVNGLHHSASRSADIFRSPGSTSVSRMRTIDQRSWGSSRSRVTVPTENGYVTSASRTGPRGHTQTRSGEVSRDDNGYSRSSDFQTSRGYGYNRDVDVQRDEHGATITRGVTTNSGASRLTTVVRQGRN